MGSDCGDAEPTPADFHRTAGDGVESTADIPAGGVERGMRFLCVFPRIDKLKERRVRAPSRSEPMLRVGEDVITFPGPRDPVDSC